TPSSIFLILSLTAALPIFPGYPGDTSPASTRAQVNAASSGDPVIAWDTHGNAYFGSEASGVAANNLSKKTNGDIWVGRYKNPLGDRKSTRLNSSHQIISYA